jgi:PadR family transcriptional regulator PadR
MYGYQIAKRLEQEGEGVLSGKQSALYPVLRNLEGGGCSTASSSPRSRPAAPLLPHYRSGREPCATGPPPGAPPAIPSTRPAGNMRDQ